ncbi:hypothetical protein JCM33374_g1388 [Metschnikowia sp. JCM 33374]|nr:hypothetical protein JCM33374_g1388 [Metschnikowia sp. JCM 33374]
MADVYVVVHFATTFDDSAVYVPRDACETIALSWCTVDAQSLIISPRQSILVKPSKTPVTPDCVSRYNLSWDRVKEGLSFKDAIVEFDRKLTEEVAGQDYSFVAVNVHDLRVSLPREARDKSVALPVCLQHPRVFDLCNEYSNWQSIHPEALSYPNSSLSNIITALDVDVASEWSEESRDNYELAVEVYAKILVQLLKKSVPVETHMSVLTKPYDTALDARTFLAERSKILYLSNLPADTTHSELESWFTQSGGRPIAFWTLKTSDAEAKSNQQVGSPKQKAIAGFAVFSKHEEAAEALYMNGRIFMDKVVEVQASSTRVLDRASNLLTPFPSSKNRPRPGDWTCPSCGFSNFQRRIACFRCSFPATSAIAIQEQIYTVPNTSSHEGLSTSGNGNNSHMRKHKQEDRQTFPGAGGYQDHYQGGMNGHKNGNAYNNGYNHGFNHNHNHNHNGNNQRSHYNNQVPFRAGDWKCPNESCQYHNFAKNLCCLKCGASKPATVMHNSASNTSNNGNHSAATNGSVGSIHSVNTTAAAIAAATASGQPLNLNNNFFGLQQPSPHHSRHAMSAQSSSSSSPIHNNGLYSNISHLQQLQFQQGKAQNNSPYSQNLGMLSNQGNSGYQGPHARQKPTHSSSSSPGLYVQQGYSYKYPRDHSEAGPSNGISSLSNQISSMSLENA